MTADEAMALLTPAERMVIAMIVRCDGSTKEAAHRLGISRFTVKGHRTNAYAKLGVQSAAECWRRLGWLHSPPDPDRARLARAIAKVK